MKSNVNSDLQRLSDSIIRVKRANLYSVTMNLFIFFQLCLVWILMQSLTILWNISTTYMERCCPSNICFNSTYYVQTKLIRYADQVIRSDLTFCDVVIVHTWVLKCRESHYYVVFVVFFYVDYIIL